MPTTSWLVGIGAIALLPGCSRYTDVLATAPAPDGRSIAATVVSAHGPMAGVFYAVTLSQPGVDPRKGEAVIEAENEATELRWQDARTLRFRLPCGTWSRLTNMYQSADRQTVITILHDQPQGCAVTPR